MTCWTNHLHRVHRELRLHTSSHSREVKTLGCFDQKQSFNTSTQRKSRHKIYYWYIPETGVGNTVSWGKGRPPSQVMGGQNMDREQSGEHLLQDVWGGGHQILSLNSKWFF